MFYKPEKGGIWDPSVIYFKGKYYMVCMYQREESGKFDSMWAAESTDGVHWEDVGCVLTAEHDVFKMFPYICGDKCLINYGSSTKADGIGNDKLYFCESEDMREWKLFGENQPDERWYKMSGRWDHMYVLPKDGGEGYWGYVVATPNPDMHSAWGIQESKDGYNWKILPPPEINWGRLPEIGMLEGGGCEKIGDWYYYIGGWGGYAHNCGYGLYTFRSKSPTGPFSPDEEAFRLCGFDRLSGRVFIQNLAAFCRGENGEALVSNAFDNGGPANVWILPIRKAVVDSEGHLRLGYWENNESVKGERLPFGEDWREIFTQRGGRKEDQPQGSVAAERDLVVCSDSGHPGFALEDAYALAIVDGKWDLEKGIVLEGNVVAEKCPDIEKDDPWTLCWRSSHAGIYIEYDDETSGMAFMLEAGAEYRRESTVEVLTQKDGAITTELLDVTGDGCATVRGIDAGVSHNFKLFLRDVMAELYVDDLLVQTFILTKKPSGRLGFVSRNAKCTWSDISLYQMNL